jgi:hypothetical protein
MQIILADRLKSGSAAIRYELPNNTNITIPLACVMLCSKIFILYSSTFGGLTMHSIQTGPFPSGFLYDNTSHVTAVVRFLPRPWLFGFGLRCQKSLYFLPSDIFVFFKVIPNVV